MTLIVIDLEWNQPLKNAKKEPGLIGEIIQIGAAKIDFECNVLDTFNMIIKPTYYKWINKDISKLTEITTEDLNNGTEFKDAIRQFRNWCGEDSVFLSWGPEDSHTLANNLWVHDMDYSWIPETYDAQLIFADIEKDEDRQYPLNYALWYFNEKPDGQHNALADVLSTVKVLSHFDVEDCLTDDYFKCNRKESTNPEDS